MLFALTLSLSHQDNEIKVEKAGGACSRLGRSNKCIQNFGRTKDGYRHRLIKFGGMKTCFKRVYSVDIYYILVVETEHLKVKLIILIP